MAFQLNSIVSLLVLALAISSSISARILDEEAAATGPVGIIPGGAGTTAAGGAGTTISGGAGTTAAGGAGTTISGGAGSTAAGGAATINPDDHSLTFFMHDILGGSHPSAIAVTGIVANPAVGGQVPFAKPNGAVLPVNNGIPTNNANGGIINNNNIPFLTGLSGYTSNIGQNNNGNNNIIGGRWG